MLPLFNPLCSPTICESKYGTKLNIKEKNKIFVYTSGLFEVRILQLGLLGDHFPFFINLCSFLLQGLGVLDKVKSLGILVSKGLFKGVVVNFLQNSLEGIKRFLKNPIFKNKYDFFPSFFYLCQ